MVAKKYRVLLQGIQGVPDLLRSGHPGFLIQGLTLGRRAAREALPVTTVANAEFGQLLSRCS